MESAWFDFQDICCLFIDDWDSYKFAIAIWVGDSYATRGLFYGWGFYQLLDP